MSDYPITVDIPVSWGDLDAFQHVNNTVYFRWFESARILYFQAVGLVDSMRDERIGPILASTSCDFKLPLTYPDQVRSSASVSRIGKSSFTMDYRIRSESSGWEVAAQGSGVVVLFDYTEGKSVRISDELRARIEGVG